MQISIVIPAFNEESRIKKSLDRIVAYMKANSFDYEIILVDDCSMDKTREIALSYHANNVFVFTNNINRGKGYCVKLGIKKAKYPIILFTDSDLATPIEEMPKFVKKIKNGADIVIASRTIKGSKIIVTQPFYRQLMGRIFPFIVHLFILQGFKDTQCGFKMFKADVAKKLVSMQTLSRFAFDVELLYIAKKHNYKINEVPVRWIDKGGSKINIITDPMNMVWDLFAIKLNDFSGKYKS